MTRVVLTVILPLLLPTALYVLWLASFGRADAGIASAWRGLPLPWLVLAGAVLTGVVLGVVVEFGGNRDGTYVPPHIEDGHVVPGHVVPVAPR